MPHRRRVLVVGAGRRVQGNFLPALKYLEDRFELCGLHSRSPERLLPVAQRWGLPALTRLADFDLANVDVVVMSVPTSQNAAVLRQLMTHAHRLHVVIDTPIAWTLEERAQSEPLLRQFARATVAEDYMNFPQFSLVRDAVRQGLVGEPLSLTLFNIGYLYHGLALIRSFAGFRPVTDSWRQPLGSVGTVIGYRFSDCFSATVVGPYRRHTTGGLLLEGSDAIITEFPIDRERAGRSKRTFVMEAMRPKGYLSGFRIAFDDGQLAVALPELDAMRSTPITDTSEINLVRGCGLIEVLRSVAGDHNINLSYGPQNAFYDSFASRRAELGKPLPDLCSTSASPSKLESCSLFFAAKTRTFVKNSMAMAATLGGGEKFEVAAGDVIEAERAEPLGDHGKLFGARLNGRVLPVSPCLIYLPAWDQK